MAYWVMKHVSTFQRLMQQLTIALGSSVKSSRDAIAWTPGSLFANTGTDGIQRTSTGAGLVSRGTTRKSRDRGGWLSGSVILALSDLQPRLRSANANLSR